MKAKTTFFSILAALLVVSTAAIAQDNKAKVPKPISYSKDIVPILDRFCTTCHSTEEEHPSELFLDSYELLMKGGKHGKAIVPGKSAESLFSQKMNENPPFGKVMPPPKKRRPTNEQIALIRAWIDEGAKNN